MSSSLIKQRSPQILRALSLSRPFSAGTIRPAVGTDDWDGRQPHEHVTNSENELDIQSSASKSGKRQRAEESHPTSAATEKDTGNDNAQAKADHPEAPGPVIGMNDERGGKGHSSGGAGD
ncbi:hypothetical protein G7Y79_00045g081020 [Physcia stellaris]|nr:hypothetical protein G7Y79_00045g081020 [Physcia stellaris]